MIENSPFILVILISVIVLLEIILKYGPSKFYRFFAFKFKRESIKINKALFQDKLFNDISEFFSIRKITEQQILIKATPISFIQSIMGMFLVGSLDIKENEITYSIMIPYSFALIPFSIIIYFFKTLFNSESAYLEIFLFLLILSSVLAFAFYIPLKIVYNLSKDGLDLTKNRIINYYLDKQV